MLTVGLDVHQGGTAACILDENGRRVKRFLHKGHPRELAGVLSTLSERFRVGFEASCGSGTLHDLLTPIAERVVVAHPGHLRLIFRSKKKNDRVDAEKIAKLLFLDEVPQVHVPGVETRAWRELIVTRDRAVSRRTAAKNGLRSLLRSHLIKAPRGLWTKSGLAWLTGLGLPTPAARLRRDIQLADLAHAERQVARLERELDRIGRAHAGVGLLRTIPGVGARTAEAVCAFIDEPRRFGAKRIGSYFGLVPRQDQSGTANRLGHITREGPPVVRRLLTEAAWRSIRCSPRVRALYDRIHRGEKERRKLALVATSHYLARVMLAMLQSGEAWREEVTA
jgi:transposase